MSLTGIFEYPVSALDDALGYGVNLDPDLLRISEWAMADGDTVRSIDYDAAGQVTAIVDSAFIGPTCEWYDNYGELCYGGTPDGEVDQASFSYDAVGNRTDSGADTDTGNRLTDLGDFSFTHDGEGRTLSKSASGFLQTYHWSDRSQLDSVTTIDTGDTTVVRYTYDGLGRRITRDGPGGFEEYLYDGDHVIAILDDQQDVASTLSYYPGVDKPHSLMTSAETYYYATDPTGSVIGLAEFTGAASVTHRYRYDVWGKPQGNVTEAAPNPIRFKARWWDDDTELYDFRARWYDPDIGRFISEDPIGLAGGINVYRFVGNDPVSGWDPSGLFDPDDGPCEEGEAVFTTTVTEYDSYGNIMHQYQQTTHCEDLEFGAAPSGDPFIVTASVSLAGSFGKGGNAEIGVAIDLRTGQAMFYGTAGPTFGVYANASAEFTRVFGGFDAVQAHSFRGSRHAAGEFETALPFVPLGLSQFLALNASFGHGAVSSFGISIGPNLGGAYNAVNLTALRGTLGPYGPGASDQFTHLSRFGE